jgi:GNAT superfamily N-acetyltransferase
MFQEERMDIMVRKATGADVAGIATILRELGWFETIIAETEDETQARVAAIVQAARADQYLSVYVAEGDDERVMGYASVHWLAYGYLAGPEGFISELYILEADRGHGVGTLLLESIQLEARVRGCHRLRLINIARRESYHREFYKRLGWEERPGDFSFEFIL